MDNDDKLIKRLTEVGFLAAGYGSLEEAATIFSAVQQERPDSEYPHIGLAFAQLNAGKHDEAIATLRDKALEARSESSLAKAFLGLALHLAGRSGESNNHLEAVVASNDDPDAVALAKGLLGSA